MKHIIYFIAIILTMFSTACMHNGGDIGHLYGQWRLEQITTGTQVEECDTVFFAFQSDIFQIRKVNYTSFETISYTGLYRRPDNNLMLNFYNYWGNDIDTKQDTVATLVSLEHLYIDKLSPLFIVKNLDSDNMVLEYNNHCYHCVKLD